MTLWINPSRPTSPPICLELDHPLCGHTCVRGSDGEANTFGSFLFDTKPSGKRPHVTSRVAVTRASLLGTRASLLVTRASLLVTSDKSIAASSKCSAASNKCIAASNRCIAASNKCITTSNNGITTSNNGIATRNKKLRSHPAEA